MDGLGLTADQEPHYVPKPPDEDGPQIPEADEEALEEIEDAVDDGLPCTDIGKALKDNAGKVKKVIDKLSKSGGAECPPDIKPELMVHYVTNEVPTCAEFPVENG